MSRNRNWAHFKAGAECGRAVKTLPVEHRDALTQLYQTQRRQLLDLGVASDWHDGALLELEEPATLDVAQATADALRACTGATRVTVHDGDRTVESPCGD